MTTPPTEEETRQLLAKAAATIDVDETAPMTLTGLPEPRPRRWPVLAAAAGVGLVIGGGFLVAQQLGDDPVPAPAPASDGPPVVPSDGPWSGLDADQLPSLIGYTEEEATALLLERGVQVQVRPVPDGCNVPGIVTGTRPAVGTRIGAGDAVKISVVVPQDVVDCVGEVPWSLVWDVVRYARGLETPVSVLDAGLAPAELDVVARMVGEPRPEGPPHLAARWNFDGGYRACPDPVGDGRWDLMVWMEVPVDGIFCPSPRLFIDYEGARIEAIHVEEPVVTEEQLEGSLDRFAAAEKFAAWARGEGPAPEFADRVRLLQGGAPPFGTQTWMRDPTDRWRYSMCSGLPPGTCGIDPIYQLEQYDGPVVPATGRALCVEGTDDLPPYLAAQASEDLVRLTKPEPPTCEQDLPVELWIGDDGLIYAVNLAGPPGT